MSTNNYIEAWLKINETCSLFKSPTISVVTIKPSAVFNYITDLTRRVFFNIYTYTAITELELGQLYLGSDQCSAIEQTLWKLHLPKLARDLGNCISCNLHLRLLGLIFL